MASRKLEVVITGDARGLERAFGRASKDSQSFGQSLKGSLAVGARTAAKGLGLGSVAAGAFGIKAIQLAGSAAEVGSKMRVVFGRQTPALIKNLDAFSEATGTSRYELRQQAADLGALLKPLTGTQEGASKMSQQFVKLATDLGSFNNVPTDEALLAIRSGLVGEAEPLRRFGVLLNEATVKNKAYALGIAATGSELTEQQKVQARAALIMEQTTLAQGDAIRTSGSFANQLKRLKATASDAATDLGVKLLPAATAVLQWANTNWPKFEAALSTGAAGAKIAFNAIQVAARAAVTWLRANVVPTVSAIVTAMVALWGRIGPVVKTAFEGAINVIRPAMRTIQAVVETVLALIRGDWSEVWLGLKEIAANGLRTALAVVRMMVGNFRAAATALGKAIWDGIKAGMAGIAGLAADLSGRVLRGIAAVAADAYTMATGIGRAIVSGVVSGVTGTAGRIGAAVKSAAQSALDQVTGFLGIGSPSRKMADEVGAPMAEGIAKGILEKTGAVKAALTQTIRDSIRDAKSNLSSLAGGLASSVGAGIDARAAGRLAAVDNSPEAKRIKEIEDSLRAEDLARERFRLEQAIATTNDANEQREAQRALNAFLLNQEAETLRATLEQRRVTIQQEETDRKVALERGLADLAGAFNRGEIRAAKFHKRVQGMLRAAGVDYADLGRMLGSSFANAFREQLQAVHDQVREIAGAPQANRITGAEPGVTQVQRRARAAPARSGSAKTVNITVNASGKAADDPSAIAGRIGRELAVAGI